MRGEAHTFMSIAEADKLNAMELRQACRSYGLFTGQAFTGCRSEHLKRVLTGVESESAVWAAVQPGAAASVPSTPAPEAVATPGATDTLADMLAAAISDRLPTPEIDESRVREIAAESGITTDNVREIIAESPSTDESRVREIVNEIIADVAGSLGTTPKALASAVVKSGKGSTLAEQALDRFTTSGAAFAPVLLVGPAGGGKTTLARQHCAGFDVSFEYQCSPDHDRSDLCGKDIPVPGENGGFGFAWSDSPITQAFRAASTGASVCLVIDEIFRLSRATRESLLSTLAPTLDGDYRLMTGRTLAVSDGVANIETIEAPVGRLAIIATTNAGSAYGVDTGCPAMAERWQYVYCGVDWDHATIVLEATASAQGWDAPLPIANALAELGKATVNLQASCELDHAASLRTLCRALQGSVPNDLESLRDSIRWEALAWANKEDDGKPIQTQVDNVIAVVSTHLSLT